MLFARRVALIKPDVALVDAEYGPSPETVNGQAFYVFIKVGGEWLIRSSRITRYVDPPPTTAPLR